MQVRSSRRRTRSPARSSSRRGRGRCSRSSPAHEQPLHKPSRDHVEARLDATCRVWERWLGFWAYDGPWEEEVARSALALKLLVYAPNGSIAAAPTTSLPEVIGGDKNYDYRYSWVRDSAFTLDALMRLGLPEQVQESFACLLRAVRQTAPDLRPFYDLDGCVPDRSEELDHLRGYRDSAPVRYGNAARTQLQLGSWGDLLETAALYVSEGNVLDDDTGEMLAACIDRVAVLWPDEDSGMWELDEHRHYTTSKMAVWMAFDRALRLAGEGQLPDGHVPQWREQHDRLRAWIEEHCWSEELGAYCGWAGEESLDAGILRAVRMGYPERERLDRTVDTIRERLAAAPGLLYRTSEHIGQEGAFVACSFWLVEALARLGRVDEACETMEQILPYANDLGLFSEEIDPETGELLGNFPQGLSHLALVNAAGAVRTLVPARVPAVHRRGQVRGEVEGRVHEREVRERLREVPEQAVRLRVVLLGIEPEVVAEVDEPPEQLVRLVVPAEQLVAVAEPERARQEHALARRQPVGSVLVRAVAEDEAVLEQLALDRLDRPADALGRSPAGSRRAAAAGGSRRAPSSRTTG